MVVQVVYLLFIRPHGPPVVSAVSENLICCLNTAFGRGGNAEFLVIWVGLEIAKAIPVSAALLPEYLPPQELDELLRRQE